MSKQCSYIVVANYSGLYFSLFVLMSEVVLMLCSFFRILIISAEGPIVSRSRPSTTAFFIIRYTVTRGLCISRSTFYVPTNEVLSGGRTSVCVPLIER